MLTSIRSALAGCYVLEQEIGRGSTAVVYAARDLKHGRRVALKVIEAAVVNTLGTRRFLQEIRTTARLNHPHILPLFDSGEADGFIYYSMPLVTGESLRDRMQRDGPLPLQSALPLIAQMASALSYAHSVGIVHRDLKPENILIGQPEHVWIADFGLARALASATDQRLTGTAIALGSPHYMSPEQAAGEGNADGRSDIYALGCVAFELLAGTPPFTGDSVPSVLARHLSEPAPSVRSRRKDVPEAIDAALQRALAKNREDRFEDANELVAALQAEPAPASAEGGPQRRWGRQRGAPHRTRPADTRRAAAEAVESQEPVPATPTARARGRRVVVLAGAAAAAVAALTLAAALLVPASDMSVALVTAAAVLLAAAVPTVAWFARGSPRVETREPDTSDAAERGHESGRSDQSEVARRVALPTAATPFIGRESELSEMLELLQSSPMRLVTVTGTGGVGKTRLALQAADRIEADFRDGVAYVALSGLASPDLLVPSIAESLGIQLSRREDPLVEVKAFLREKQLLLLLDNFEHLTAAAGELSALLDVAPDVRMLVTSRERLSLKHETLVVLEGLSQNGDDGGEAVELFVAGARRLDRTFALDDEGRVQVAHICALLGGIPLAIELASAWIRTLSCAEILAELKRDLDVLTTEAPDLEARHHSLRATFDASWRLLSSEEQSALARLGVFRSAFDRTAAAAVGGASAAVLRQLVDKSLLSRTGDRLLMLDVVRAYALEQLVVDPAAERRARDRHLHCFSGMLHDLEARVRRADATATQRIAESIDDVRAAWGYAVETRNEGALLAAADALYHFYEARGWVREGLEMFTAARTAFGRSPRAGTVQREVRVAAARLDVRRGVFLHRLGDLQVAESVLRETVPVLRELDDTGEVVFALHRLGAVRHGMGDYADAERLHHEGWELARAINDRLAIGWSMTYLGNVAWSRGDFDAATQLYTDALVLLREENDLNGMWVTLNNLGVIAASRQQYDEAQRRFREGLTLQSRLRNARFEAHTLHNLGSAARELGNAAQARAWLDESLAISTRMGYRSVSGMTYVGLAQLALCEGDDAAAIASLHQALRTAAAVLNHPLALEALLVLAQLRLRQNDRAGARALASIVARHPGSDRDVRRRTTVLFEELGGEPPLPQADQEPPDLGSVIGRIVGAAGDPLAHRPGLSLVPAPTPEEP